MHVGTGRTVYKLLRERAAQAPDAIALCAPGRDALSFGGLLRQVDHVVGSLFARGIRSTDCVAVVLPNGPEMAAAFLGVAGGAICAPLNAAYSRREFEYYLSDLDASALMVQSGVDSAASAVAQERSIPIIELYSSPAEPAGSFALRGVEPSPKAHFQGPQAADIALILHTSGTTSGPKMVPLTHENILASAANIVATLRLSDEDRCLNVMPLFHIHGLIGALLSSVVAGASVICTPGFDIEQFFPWLSTYKPTWYTAVPTIHHAVLVRGRTDRVTQRYHSLRFIRSSSAALPGRVMQGLEEIFKVPVIESYGMTEAAHQMASNPLPPAERKPGSVGKPAGPEIAIMDEVGKLQAAGTTGEVVIRGANVTSGYINNAESNNECFEQGWFRTGDQGYLDRHGYLFLTGRIKELINRGGEKVSPREIDDILLSHPAVEQAVTFAVPHPTLGEEVAAAVVLRPQTHLSVRELSAFIANRLADFKVPKQLVIVDEIPKSATGKIQRIGLAQTFAKQFKRQFIAAQNDLEAAVTEIYAEVLSVEQVSATDDFFALGGDSLRATQVISRIRARFDVDLSIATVFRKSTVAELAHEIAQLQADSDRG